MATLTTVTSRIDMTAPSTTTDATSIRSRSMPAPFEEEGEEAIGPSVAERHPPFVASRTR
jgi:hypothetical protein